MSGSQGALACEEHTSRIRGNHRCCEAMEPRIGRSRHSIVLTRRWHDMHLEIESSKSLCMAVLLCRKDCSPRDTDRRDPGTGDVPFPSFLPYIAQEPKIRLITISVKLLYTGRSYEHN
jgi:hypothetical protein